MSNKEDTFLCKYCGKKVRIVPGEHDRRRKFCSKECRKKYFKVPGKYAGQPAWKLNFLSAKKFKKLEERLSKVGRES